MFVPLKQEDLNGKSDAELAYAVICQLAIASATIANIFRRVKDKPYSADQFMIGFENGELPPSLREVLEKVKQQAADMPLIVLKKQDEAMAEATGWNDKFDK